MKNCMPPLTALLLAITTLWTNASGQTIYKCGTVYSQSPCPGAVAVDASDGRTPAQKAEADANTTRAAKSAARMEKERLALEKSPAGKPPLKSTKTQPAAKGGATGSNTKPGAKQKKKEPEYFTAAVAPEPKKTKKAAAKSDTKPEPESTGKPVKP